MSHVTKFGLKVTSLDALKSACTEIGLEFAEGQKQYKWYGTYMGDSPLPEGFTKQDLGKCEHAIRVPNSERAYEIGVARNKAGDGYELLWDYWQGGYGLAEKVGGQDGHKLKQAYNKNLTTQHWAKKGFRSTVTQQDNGRLVIRSIG